MKFYEMVALYDLIKDNKLRAQNSTGEVKQAFETITKDFLWKLNLSMGKLQNEIITQYQTIESSVLEINAIEKRISEECEAKEVKFANAKNSIVELSPEEFSAKLNIGKPGWTACRG